MDAASRRASINQILIGTLLSSPIANLLKETREIEQLARRCAKASAPLFALLKEIRTAPPKKPIVIFPDDSGPDIVTHLNIYGLELDAEEIRSVVGYLKFDCWSGYWNYGKTEEYYPHYYSERLDTQGKHTVLILRETIKNDLAKIDQKRNHIADILEFVERRQRR